MAMRKAAPTHLKRIVSMLTASVLLFGTLIVGIEAAHPASAQSASPIIRAAFYYPWFPTAWTQDGIYPYTNYTPSNGYYSSNDSSVVKQQIAAMQYGHLDAGIISWRGQPPSQEDSVVPTDLAASAGTGFKWSLYYEPEGSGDPSVVQIQSDLSYIKAKYASNPSYLTIAGKPVIFVYADANDGCGMATRWSQANATQGFYTVLKVFPGYAACADQPSSWHQYAPATTEDHQPGFSFSISPGFNKAGESAPRLARNLTTWDQNIKDMVASNEQLQLVTTFNEWGEGSAVESATQWATPSGYGAYLDTLHNDIPLAPPPVSPALLRYPYTSEAVGNSATLNWGTDRSQSTGSATWGAVSNGTCTPSNSVPATKVAITVGSTSEYQWSARLAFPGSGTYCYRTQLGTTDLLGPDPSPQVKTAAAPGSPFSFAVVGDFGQATTGEANVMSQIGASSASFVVSTGDTDNTGGSDTDYGDLTQGNVFPSAYLPKVGSRPIFAAQGNHGFTTNLPYLQNFPAPIAAQSSGGRNLQESYCCISTMSGAQNYASSWYAFDWGGARFYVLEAAWADGQGGYQGDFLAHWNGAVSGCGPCGAELAWLKSDLAAHATTPIKFAFFHYPLYADNGGEPSDTYVDGANGLEGLLADNSVDIVFNGHAHQYERNYPQIAGKPLVSYVTGGGGATLGSISGCSAFDAYAIGSGSSCHAPKPTSDAHVYEYLLVTVNGGQVTVTPTDSTGQAFDQQTYSYATTPATVIDTPPPALTNSTSATISFHSTGGGSAFTCGLDGAPASACASPVTLSGLTSGPHSLTVTGAGATPATANWTVDTSPPTTPTGLAATATSPTRVDLTWAPSTDDSGVTGYDIYRNGTLLITTSGTGTTYADTTVAASTTYQYTVDARDGAGNASQRSAPASVTTPAPASGPVFVQTAASSTNTVSLPAPSRSGDLLVLTAGVYTGATKPITAVSDGKNTWSKVGGYFVSGQYSDGEVWYSANAASVSSVTVTTGAAAVALRVQEFSGVATFSPLDASKGAAGRSAAPNSGPATPTTANDLAVGFIAGHANAQTISVTSGGYTVQPQQTTTGSSTVTVETAYQALGTTATQSFAGTFGTTMYWSSGIALFKAASTAPPPPDFSMAAAPDSVSVAQGSAATSAISTTVTSGAAQSVALSATGVPSGALVSFNPQVITAGQSSTMTITTSTSTPLGASTITVTGTGASTVHSVPVTLNVTSASTPKLVQSVGATESGPSTTLTGTFPAATTAGHLLVLSVSEYTGATNHITSVTDSAGNSWSRIGAYSVSGHYSNGEMWYSANAVPATSVTVHTASAAFESLEVQEFSGVATTSPLATSAGTSNTSTSASSGSTTSTIANELAVGFVAGHGNSQTITVTASGYTAQSQQSTTGTIARVVTGYKVLGTTGAQNFTGTFGTAMYWASGIAIFKPGS
jgi:hypothetical protein